MHEPDLKCNSLNEAPPSVSIITVVSTAGTAAVVARRGTHLHEDAEEHAADVFDGATAHAALLPRLHQTVHQSCTDSRVEDSD